MRSSSGTTGRSGTAGMRLFTGAGTTRAPSRRGFPCRLGGLSDERRGLSADPEAGRRDPVPGPAPEEDEEPEAGRRDPAPSEADPEAGRRDPAPSEEDPEAGRRDPAEEESEVERRVPAEDGPEAGRRGSAAGSGRRDPVVDGAEAAGRPGRTEEEAGALGPYPHGGIREVGPPDGGADRVGVGSTGPVAVGGRNGISIGRGRSCPVISLLPAVRMARVGTEASPTRIATIST